MGGGVVGGVGGWMRAVRNGGIMENQLFSAPLSLP